MTHLWTTVAPHLYRLWLGFAACGIGILSLVGLLLLVWVIQNHPWTGLPLLLVVFSYILGYFIVESLDD